MKPEDDPSLSLALAFVVLVSGILEVRAWLFAPPPAKLARAPVVSILKAWEAPLFRQEAEWKARAQSLAQARCSTPSASS